ncbi:Uu.00g104370.m01.CDS01 [Anthostomella pinea]|uniref:Uu.00g104370.m01.CDS01 n=1 Tax=Anthostomella pinea TaxID=933095 RepID=A0AAI8YFL2_9PEZI|nr:Uu.00g104370.m01.CDS01 [Anthostomella pinea]
MHGLLPTRWRSRPPPTRNPRALRPLSRYVEIKAFAASYYGSTQGAGSATHSAGRKNAGLRCRDSPPSCRRLPICPCSENRTDLTPRTVCWGAAIIKEPIFPAGGILGLAQGLPMTHEQGVQEASHVAHWDAVQAGVPMLFQTLGRGPPLAAVSMAEIREDFCDEAEFLWLTTHLDDALTAAVGYQIDAELPLVPRLTQNTGRRASFALPQVSLFFSSDKNAQLNAPSRRGGVTNLPVKQFPVPTSAQFLKMKYALEMVSRKGRLVHALSQVTKDGSDFTNGQDGAREKLIASARELVALAETPVESLLWNIWSQPTRTVAARIAVDLKFFKTAVREGGRPKTDAELAAPTGASPTLVKRIARTCVSMRMLDEKGPGLYVPNGLTSILAQPEYAAGIVFCFDSAHLSYSQMPAYLRSTNFQNPEDPANGPFQYANNYGGHAFGWLAEQPEVFQAFHGYVHALRMHRPSWTDMYPVQKHLVEGLRPEGDAPALVDVGVGTGQILEDFRTSVPQYTGRLVLQELPDVISAASGLGVGMDSRIE